MHPILNTAARYTLCLTIAVGTMATHRTAVASLEEALMVLLDDDTSVAPPINPQGGKPNHSTTGPQTPSSQLTPSGSITVTVPGTVIEGLYVTGSISVQADNVTIRDSIIKSDSYFGIRADFGATNLLVENVEITDALAAGITGSNYTLRRSRIHEMGADAIKVYSNVLIEHNYIRHLGTDPGSHADGIQMTTGSNVVIQNNTIDMPYDLPGYENSQCMIIQTDQGPIDDVLINGNWLNGGGFCVQINDKNFGPPSNVRLIRNKFGRDHQYGPMTFFNTVPVRFSNEWEDTGEPVQ